MDNVAEMFKFGGVLTIDGCEQIDIASLNLPWKPKLYPNAGQVIEDRNGDLVAHTLTTTEAVYIIRAVNMHNELINGLEETITEINKNSMIPCCSTFEDNMTRWTDLIKRAKGE